MTATSSLNASPTCPQSSRVIRTAGSDISANGSMNTIAGGNCSNIPIIQQRPKWNSSTSLNSKLNTKKFTSKSSSDVSNTTTHFGTHNKLTPSRSHNGNIASRRPMTPSGTRSNCTTASSSASDLPAQGMMGIHHIRPKTAEKQQHQQMMTPGAATATGSHRLYPAALGSQRPSTQAHAGPRRAVSLAGSALSGAGNPLVALQFNAGGMRNKMTAANGIGAEGDHDRKCGGSLHHMHMGSPWDSSKPARMPLHGLRQEYEQVLATRNGSDRELRESLRKLRRMILTDGLPDDEASHEPTTCSLRGRVWKVLLGIYRISALDYVTLVERGKCEVYDKIKNDTFRTMATDKKFLAKVNENMLSRLLNAFVWKAKDQPPSRLINLKYSYVQGMNVLSAPFLYVMPELDAFYTFTSFIQHSCPLYVQPALEGVHCGLKLLDKCLKVADPHLFRYLRSKKLVGKLYAFPSVMTLCACTPPLQELLMLWDFYFAYGVHLNILCIVAQLILMRDDLMNAPSPMRLLRNFPDLNTRAIIPVTLSLIPQLPEDLYDMLVRHPFDPMVYDLIMTDQDVAPGGGVGGQENEDEDEDDDL